jgi:8-oxo-dGTP diphosphatase
MDSEISSIYGDRVRVRACGLCWHNDALLMVKHLGLAENDFWAPPGGGVDFGKTVAETLIREFDEETGIKIEPGRLLFIGEFVAPPLHAIELYFEVFYKSGDPKPGMDPEMSPDRQIIQEVDWLTQSQIMEKSHDTLHGVFRLCKTPKDLMNLTGIWKI